MPSAAPARPRLAIWWPSRQVTTEAASPGMLTRIEVVQPPYMAPSNIAASMAIDATGERVKVTGINK